MKGDFTRFTFDRARHFTGVRLQQGRVQIDADWNEQVDLTTYRTVTEAVDVIGPCGAPKHHAGFAISPLAGGDFSIGAGRFYAGGWLCENDAVVAFTAQPDLPGTVPIAAPGRYLVYLDVWTRHLTALEVPAIRETALGGPDTATRTRIVWQVKLLQGHLLDPLPEPADIVVANLPYVTSADYHTLDRDVRYEPQLALEAGAQGLDAITGLLRQVPAHLKAGGTAILEIGYNQGEAVLALVSQIVPQALDLDLRTDYQGHDRVVTFCL